MYTSDANGSGRLYLCKCGMQIAVICNPSDFGGARPHLAPLARALSLDRRRGLQERLAHLSQGLVEGAQEGLDLKVRAHDKAQMVGVHAVANAVAVLDDL